MPYELAAVNLFPKFVLVFEFMKVERFLVNFVRGKSYCCFYFVSFWVYSLIAFIKLTLYSLFCVGQNLDFAAPSAAVVIM